MRIDGLTTDVNDVIEAIINKFEGTYHIDNETYFEMEVGYTEPSYLEFKIFIRNDKVGIETLPLIKALAVYEEDTLFSITDNLKYLLEDIDEEIQGALFKEKVDDALEAIKKTKKWRPEMEERLYNIYDSLSYYRK